MVPVQQLSRPPLGDIAEFRYGKPEEVHGQSNRLAVEIADAEALVCSGKNKRIVCRRIDLCFNDSCYVVDGIARSAVYLGGTTDGIRVLHLLTGVVIHAIDQPAAADHCTDVACGMSLARVRPGRESFFCKRCTLALDRLHREGGGNIRNVGQTERIMNGQCTHGRHCLRAIVERKALFRLEHHRLYSCGLQRLLPRHSLSLVDGLPFADQHRSCV